jgi:hypothetical protein
MDNGRAKTLMHVKPWFQEIENTNLYPLVEHENLDFDFDFFRMITKFLLSQISRREILKISSKLPGETPQPLPTGQ